MMGKLVFWIRSFVVVAVLCAPAALSSQAGFLAAADTQGAAPHGDEGGLQPKGPIDFKSDLAIWSLVSFILLVLVLKKFAWGPLTEGLDTREQRIRQDIADAEESRKKAEQMLAAHAAKLDAVQDEVREIIAEARRDAEHTKQEIVEAAQKESEATKQRAVSEIERARDAALKDLLDTQASQVAQATEHVLGRSLNADDQERLIQEALSQFSNN